MPKFFLDLDLRTQGLEASVEKVANTVQQALGRLASTRGLSGPDISRGFVDIQTSGLAAVETLRRQGAPQASLDDLTRTINQQLASFKNTFPDFNKTIGIAGQGFLQSARQAERTARSLADLYLPPGARDAARLAAQAARGSGGPDTDEQVGNIIDAKIDRTAIIRALNATNDYAEASALLAREENRLASRIARENAKPENVRAAAERHVETERTRRLRDIEGEGLRTPGDAQDQGFLNALRKDRAQKEGIATERIFAQDSTFISQTAELNALRRRRVRAEERATLALTGSPDDLRLDAELAAAKRRRLRREQQLTEAQFTPLDNAAEGQLQATRQRRVRAEQVALEQTLNASDVQATAQLNALRRRRVRAEERATLAATGAPEDVRLDAELAAAKRRRLRRVEQSTEAQFTPVDAAAEAQLQATRRRRARAEGIALERQIAGDAADAAATAELNVLKRRRVRAEERATLAALSGPADVQADAELAVAKRRRARSEEQIANTLVTPLDTTAEAQLQAVRRSRARAEGIALERTLAADLGDARATAELNALKQRRVRAESFATLEATSGPLDIQGDAQLTLARQRRARLEQQALERLTTPLDTAAEAQLQATRRRRARAEGVALEQSLAADNSYIRETTELALLRRRRATAEAQALLVASRATIVEEANLRLAQRQRRAQEGAADATAFESLGPLGQTGLIQAEGQAAAARKKQAALIEQSTQQQLQSDRDYINATVRAKAARERIALEQRLGSAGILRRPGESDDEVSGRARFSEEESSIRQRVAYQRQILDDLASNAAAGGQFTRLKLQERQQQRDINRALQQRLIAEERAAGVTGTAFQRAQQQLHARRGGEAQSVEDFSKFGQFLGQRALTTVGYAAGGTLLFGAVNGIQEAIRAAEQLERVMATVRKQFESAGQASDFEGFSDSILGIARDSGVAASEVATVAFQMKGAYGSTTRAVEETRGAIRASVVTGIEQRELTDSLTAASLTYGESIEGITDKALGLEERFGVLAKESLKVFGDMATVANQAGLSIDELGALVGVVQQASGRGGAAIAEGFGRVLPAVQGSAAEILRLYDAVPALKGRFDEVAKGFQEGRTGDVLLQLVKDYESLDKSTQNYVIQLLGGRREAQLLIPLFQNSSKVIEELGRTESDAGKTAERFASIQQTLAQAMKRLAEEGRQLGVALARLGVFDALKVLAGGLIFVVSAAGKFLDFWADVNESMDGIPGKVVALVTALKGLQLVLKGIAATQAFLGTIKGIQAVATGATAAAAASGGYRIGGIGTPTPVPVPAGGAGAGWGFLGLGALGRFGQSSIGGALPGALGGATGAISARIGALGAVGAGLATGAVFVGTAVALEKAIEARNKLQDQMDGQLKGITESLKDRDLFELLDNERVSKGVGRERSGFTAAPSFVGLGAFISGRKTPYEIYLKEIEDETLRTFEEALDQGVFAKTEENKQLLADLGSNDGGKRRKAVEEAVRKIKAARGKDAAKIRQIAADSSENQAVLDTGGSLEILNAAQAAAAYQSGEKTYAEYQLVLNQTAAALTAADNNDIEFHQKVLDAQRAARQAVSENLANNIRLRQQILQQSGEDPSVVLPDILRTLGDPRLLPAQADQVIQAYYATQQTELKRSIQNAPNQRAALEAAVGTPIDPQVRKALEEYYKQNGITAKIPTHIRATDDELRAIRQSIAQEDILRLQAENVTQDPQKQAQLQLKIAALQKLAATNDTQRLNADIAAQQAMTSADDARQEVLRSRIRLAQAGTEDPAENARLEVEAAEADRQYAVEQGLGEAAINDAQARVDQARRAARDVQRGAIASRIRLAQARTENPVAIAELELRAAQLELRNAVGEEAINDAQARVEQSRRQVRDAQRAVADSRYDIARARAAGNELALAQIELRQADDAVRRAGNDEAAQNQAIAQRLTGERAVADALFNIAQSRLELAATMQEVSGDAVGASATRLRQAQEALNRQIALDPTNEAAINELRGTVARAQASSRDTQLGEQQRQIDVALELERITVSQAISQLQALLQVPGITQEQTDNLLTKIKGLKDQLGQDFQFNIPTEIRLPTLYEVRRSHAAEQAGTGYNDNRQISVQMINHNSTDYEGAIARFQALVEGAPRYGTSARKY